MANEHYTEGFYNAQSVGSYDSACVVAEIIQDLCPVESVLDVGCGVGTWLKAFSELGVNKILGVDGDYVSGAQLLIPVDRFQPTDLESVAELPTGFDLVVCAEVLEHLTERAGERLVSLMTDSAPIILFSAAIPGQGGENHINERWHHHWHDKFSKHGFSVYDIVRPQIFADTSVAWWYRQNLFIYASEEGEARWPKLSTLKQSIEPGLVPINPNILTHMTSIRGLLKLLSYRVKQKVFG